MENNKNKSAAENTKIEKNKVERNSAGYEIVKPILNTRRRKS